MYMRGLVFEKDSKLFAERSNLELVLRQLSDFSEKADTTSQAESDSEEVVGHYRLLCKKTVPKHTQVADPQALSGATSDILSPLLT